jgi:uncharacterized protein with NRDE domain
VCLIAFAIGASQRWPLVIASNRDEFLSRPTLPLASWKTNSGQEIISGRDLRAGGTWLGMTPSGRVAFLTNVREAMPKTASLSRGELVMRWLDSSSDAEGFLAKLEKDCSAYAGFNLVFGDFQRNAWAWVTNKSSAAVSGWHAQALQPGVYGLSNAALDTPWPKTMELKRVLAASLADQVKGYELDKFQGPLWTALFNQERAPFGQLPATGVPQAMEEALSSAFVEFSEHAYGTRSSTVLVASRTDSGANTKRWQIQVEERTHLRGETHQIAGLGPASMAIANLNFVC